MYDTDYAGTFKVGKSVDLCDSELKQNYIETLVINFICPGKIFLSKIVASGY